MTSVWLRLPARVRGGGTLVAAGLAYAAVQGVGLQLVHPVVGVAVFWPAAGVAMAILWHAAPRRWPAFLAAMAAASAVTTLVYGATVGPMLAVGLANLAEAAGGALLLRRFVAPRPVGPSPYGWVLRGLVPAALLPTAVGGAISALVIIGTGGEPVTGRALASTWWTWFAADAVGVLAGLPAAVALLAARRPRRLLTWRLLEAAVVVTAQALLFAAAFAPPAGTYPSLQWSFVLLPAVLWSAARLGPGVTAAQSTALAAAVVWATENGRGPLAGAGSVHEQMLAVQLFCALMIATALFLANLIYGRQRAEALLDRRSWAMANAVEGISFVDRDGRLESVNAAFAGMLDRAPEQLVGSGWLDHVHPDDRAQAAQCRSRTIETGKADVTVRGMRAGERTFRMELTLIAERDRAGRLVGHHCFVRDVTERDAAREHLDQFFLLSPELLCVTDADGRFRRVNPAWERLLGHSVSDLVGRRFVDLVHADDAETTGSEVARLLAGGEPRAFENRYRAADGSYCWLQWNGAFDAERRLFFGVAHDVTSVRETQRSLAEARDQAVAVSQLKSQFLATMSHEIRTPMNGVIGLSDLLAETDLGTDQERYVDGIRVAGTSLLGIINEVLDFSKIEAGKFVLDDAPVDLRSLVADVARLNEQSATSKEVDLVTDVDAALPAVVRGDPMRLRQILLNLASNAVKFTDHGRVDIRVTVADGDAGRSSRPGGSAADPSGVLVRFEVSDTGSGMAPATLETLFDPFTQADASTTRVYGGTGLGLAITHRLVDAMGGSIDVTSEVGVGSTFRVTVPLTVTDETGPAGATDPRQMHILVVDDDATSRMVLQRQITDWGMVADAVPDARAALTTLRQAPGRGRRYDVAVIDMCMPGADGFHLAEAIAADTGVPSLPVVLLTSGDVPAPTEVRRAGIGAVLTKPVSRSDMYDALCTVVTEPTEAGLEPDHRGRVLVVEDNAVNQTVASGILNRLGYTVDVAEDGLQALTMADAQPYEAILMDCHMPRMDGYTATRHLRERAMGTRTPIIAMTANALKEDRERCLAAGMDDYLPKPVRAHDLDVTLTRWTRSRPGSDSPGLGSAVPAQAVRTRPAVLDRLVEIAGDGTPEELALVATVARSFGRRAPEMLAQVADAVDRGDWTAAHRHAHSLKGAAGNLGAAELAEVSEVVETLAERGDGDSVRRQRARLQAALDQALKEVRDGAAELAAHGIGPARR